MIKRISALILAVLLLVFMSPAETAAAEEKGVYSSDPAMVTNGNKLFWYCRIKEDREDGEYFTKLLGLNNVTRQSVIRTVRENWKDGLKYGEANYSLSHWKADTCVNCSGKQLFGREKSGYGYNCTGFVASVLYYANGGTADSAMADMTDIYLPLKQGRSYRNQSAFTDGTGWYYFFDGEQYTSKGKVEQQKTRIYFMGDTSGAQGIQNALRTAAVQGKLKKGYLIFFWPSGGYDCHVGIYAGRDPETGNYMMYHAVGKGTHSGVKITEHITLSQAVSEGASYLYIIPLPEGPDEPESQWAKEGRSFFRELTAKIEKSE